MRVSAEGERANFRTAEWENEDWKAQQDKRETGQHSDARRGMHAPSPVVETIRLAGSGGLAVQEAARLTHTQPALPSPVSGLPPPPAPAAGSLILQNPSILPTEVFCSHIKSWLSFYKLQKMIDKKTKTSDHFLPYFWIL